MSVKVLWPKTEEEKKKARNSGFVQFATRIEAERAMEGMRDKEIMGQVPRLGWGRAPKHQSATHTFPPPPSHSEFNIILINVTRAHVYIRWCTHISQVLLLPRRGLQVQRVRCRLQHS